VNKANGSSGLLLPQYMVEQLQQRSLGKSTALDPDENPDPVPIGSQSHLEDFNVLRGKPSFNITFDLEGKTIGKFFYEDKQLKFEGDVDESAQIWIDWVIAKFMEWHDDENIK